MKTGSTLAFATLTLPAVILLTGCLPAPAPKPAPVLPASTVTYTCAGNKPLKVAYDNGTATLPGPETLLSDPVASGQHYSWPADGSHHIWVIGADGLGTLSLGDKAKGTETVQLSGCKADVAQG